MTGRAQREQRWGLIAASVLIALLSIPMALDLVEPNGFYGFRTAASLASEEAWYRANRTAGVAGVVFGLASAAINWRIGSMSMSANRRFLIGVGALVGAAMLIGLAGALAV